MKKIIRTMTLALCLLFTILSFSACQTKEPMTEDPKDTAPPTVSQDPTFPEDEGARSIEGDIRLERAYDARLYSINSSLLQYIQENNKEIDLNGWLQAESEKTKQLKYGISAPEEVPSLLSVIKEFRIPRSAFEAINDDMIAGYEKREGGGQTLIAQYCYSKEEIDALYSEDPSRITETFAAEYAVVANGKAYAPNFYLYATEEELNTYGISAAQIKTQKDRLLSDNVLTEDK